MTRIPNPAPASGASPVVFVGSLLALWMIAAVLVIHPAVLSEAPSVGGGRSVRPIRLVDDPLPPPAPTLAPTPTEAPAHIRITIARTVARCATYVPHVYAAYQRFPVDPALVLAIAARETACDEGASDSQSVGLMAVLAGTRWTPSADALRNPATSIRWGMWLLHSALTDERNPGSDPWLAAAIYNCGWTYFDTWCAARGSGFADDVIDVFYPEISAALDEYARRPFSTPDRQRVAAWLVSLGYGGSE